MGLVKSLEMTKFRYDRHFYVPAVRYEMINHTLTCDENEKFPFDTTGMSYGMFFE